MSPTPHPCVCTALRKASRAVTRLYDERLGAAGMTTTQFAVLRHLARHGDLALPRLADLLVMDRTSLYRTLAPIERHGWIRLGPGGRGRARQAALTGAGHAALDAATPAWEACQRDVLAALGEDALLALQARLGEVVDASRRIAA